VATSLAKLGKKGDVVAYCPDQLGPSVSRLLPPDRYRQITFPRETGPLFVNWVDYAKATGAGNPARFAAKVESLAGSTHTIYLVWASGYETYHTKCEAIVNDLLADHNYVPRTVFAATQLLNTTVIYEHMGLVEYVPVAGG
jgi:mannosyltransferase